MKRSIKTPHAAVIVWNYKHRLGGDNGTSDINEDEVNDVDEVIISSLSISGITTSKTKEGSVGSFQINLAPTRNWTSALTSGSWLAIMMSQSPITEADVRKKANLKKIKFLGRIESVRVAVTPNQQTGARQTSYVLHGCDWCSFFQNQIYLDAFLSTGDQNNFGAATTLAITSEFYNVAGERSLYSTDAQLSGLLAVFGKPITGKFGEGVSEKVNRILEVKYSFSMPEKLRTFFGFKKQGILATDNKIVNMVELFTGKLVAEDKYEATSEAIGLLNYAHLRGAYSMWQILQDHSNKTLNEMLADLRWTEEGPTLALYNRIKPFTISSTAPADFSSSYSLIKKHLIPLEDIITIEAGTNWRDRCNAVEIRYDAAALGVSKYENGIVQVNQASDPNSFNRDGLHMRLEESRHFPKDAFETDKANLFGSLKQWTAILKEWYFNTHRQLNGTIAFAGQDNYIQIGDNLLIPIQILGISKKVNKQALEARKYLLLHVETIRQTFGITESGARTYTTLVDFVRGVVVDDTGKVSSDSFLDESVSTLSLKDEQPSNVVISKSHGSRSE